MVFSASYHRSYSLTKDSENNWLGKIPDHWGLKRLKWFITISSGKMISRDEVSDQFDVIHPIPVIGGNGIMGFCNKKLGSDPKIVIGRVGAHCGNVHLIEGPSWVTDNALMVRKIKNYDIRYLTYLLRSRNLNVLSTGTAQPLITGSMVKNQKFPIPPIEEQINISNYLHKKTSIFDEILSKKHRLIELLQEKQQALITQTVTKGLDFTVPMKDSGLEWLVEIPEYWETLKLKFLSRINKESLGEKTDPKYVFYYVEIGNVTIEGLKNELPLLIFEKSPSRARRIVRKNDVLISTVRTYLKAITWFPDPPQNLIASTGFAVITPSKNINPNYLYFFIRSQGFVDTVMANSVGVTYPAINSSVIANLKICFPPPDEQDEIVSYLSKEDLRISKIIKKLLKQIELIKEYRQTVITNVVTGKIDIRGET